MSEDYITFFSTLLGADWQALFVLAVAVVPPGSPWRRWEVARERAILVVEARRPDLPWTEERRALVRGAWVAWQRAEHALAAREPDESGIDLTESPPTVLRALLGQDWRTLLLTIGAGSHVPAGRLYAACERVVTLAQQRRPDLRWTEALREQVRRAWLAWWADGDRRPEAP